jgi:hypothetical protein
MALTDTQLQQLRAKLDARHVKTRQADGTELHYVEGWHVIAEANRIFGFDAWDRRTVSTNCVFSSAIGQSHFAAYIAKVRVTVRAGDTKILREGSGTGEAKASSPGQAHELALKGAETDATKRALATFGNPFGLALYDREQGGVSRRRGAKLAPALGRWILRAASGADQAIFEKPSEFAAALQTVMSAAEDIELLFAIWEQNVETVRAVNRAMRQDQLPKSGIAPQLVAHLKRCAIALVKPAVDESPDSQSSAPSDQILSGKQKIDKSVLTIGQTKRIRCKEHLRFVASHPCAICGRSPSHAHHVRHAQSRGLSLKVSDEFTVPLCATHHHQIHTTGKERDWWQQRNIDPLIIAKALWQQSRDRHPAAGKDEASKDQSSALDVTQPREQSPNVSRTQPPERP